jgi:hypothetical protein
MWFYQPHLLRQKVLQSIPMYGDFLYALTLLITQIPSALSRILWQLCLDMSGGHLIIGWLRMDASTVLLESMIVVITHLQKSIPAL